MSTRTPLVHYYRCYATEGRNAEFPIHVMMAGNLDWEENSLQQRGLLGNLRLTRPMDARELQGRNKSYRAKSYKYKNLAGLLEDERACGQPAKFLEALRAAFSELDRESAVQA